MDKVGQNAICYLCQGQLHLKPEWANETDSLDSVRVATPFAEETIQLSSNKIVTSYRLLKKIQ